MYIYKLSLRTYAPMPNQQARSGLIELIANEKSAVMIHDHWSIYYNHLNRRASYLGERGFSFLSLPFLFKVLRITLLHVGPGYYWMMMGCVLTGTGGVAVAEVCISMGTSLCASQTWSGYWLAGTRHRSVCSTAPLCLRPLPLSIHWGPSQTQAQRQVDVTQILFNARFQYQVTASLEIHAVFF